MHVLPVPGTRAWPGRQDGTSWFDPSSPFMEALAAAGITHLAPSRPFVWTTDLNGARFWRRSDHKDWRAGGVNLYAYLDPPHAPHCAVPLADRNLIAHSHGLQLVLYACAAGLTVNRLISVASPVRRDMRGIADQARPNIASWLHLHSDHSDRYQWLGEIGDGAIGIVRRHPLADANLRIPGAGHGRLLHDPAYFSLWRDWLASPTTPPRESMPVPLGD